MLAKLVIQENQKRRKRMSNFAFALMLMLMFIAIYVLGWFTGTVWERIRWNILIEKGVIPKPKRR